MNKKIILISLLALLLFVTACNKSVPTTITGSPQIALPASVDQNGFDLLGNCADLCQYYNMTTPRIVTHGSTPATIFHECYCNNPNGGVALVG